MKDLLDFTGALLYFAFCIVSFPLLLIVHTFFGLLIINKYIVFHVRRFTSFRSSQKRAAEPFAVFGVHLRKLANI
jgi:hypothetical protein